MWGIGSIEGNAAIWIFDKRNSDYELIGQVPETYKNEDKYMSDVLGYALFPGDDGIFLCGFNWNDKSDHSRGTSGIIMKVDEEGMGDYQHRFGDFEKTKVT